MKPTYEELEQQLAESHRALRAETTAHENLKMQLEKMAAENAGLKSKGRELLGEACAVYAKLNKLIDPAIGDFIDGQTLHEFQFVLDCETPSTDAFLAEVRAQESKRVYESILDNPAVTDMESLVDWLEQNANDSVAFAAQLRKGAQS